MRDQLPAPEIAQFRDQLVELGRVHPDELIEPLSGGVSGIVVLAHHSPEPFVAKTARPRLAVEDDWFADTSRTYREAQILSLLDGSLGGIRVPRVVFFDEPSNILAIEAFVPVPPTWKDQLLESKFDSSIVEAVAGAVAALHRLAPPPTLDRTLGAELFDDLRLDPYYRWVAQAHPGLAPSLNELIDSTLSVDAPTLVHGDVSPKNVLVTEQGPVLLDFEVIHVGDPAFDLGMLMAHLTLKALFHGGSPTGESLSDAVLDFWAHYQDHGGPADEGRVARHLGGVMLARILGKSKVSYLTSIQSESAVRLGTAFVAGLIALGDAPRSIRLELECL
ncbi:MAG: phosphotransferase family protein [Acidimicrobiia bacterium]